MIIAFAAVVKVFGIVLTGIFGLIGLLTDYKDKNGKVTVWGRRALIGTFVSTSIALIAQGLDTWKQTQDDRDTNQKSLEQAKSNNAILQQINRVVDPLNSIDADIWLEIDANQIDLKSYRDRVFLEISKVNTAGIPENGFIARGTRVSMTAENPKRIVQISIDEESNLFPDKNKETIAYYAFRYIDTKLTLFQREASIRANPGDEIPNVEISFDTADKPAKSSIILDLETKKIQIFAQEMHPDSKFWRTSGNPLAIPDLAGRHARFTVESIVTTSPNDKTTTERLAKIRSTLIPQTVLLQLSHGRQIWLRSWPQPSRDELNRAIYDFVFPNPYANY